VEAGDVSIPWLAERRLLLALVIPVADAAADTADDSDYDGMAAEVEAAVIESLAPEFRAGDKRQQ